MHHLILGGSMSVQFRSHLSRFNRKERFYVVREATKGGFELDDVFRLRLEEKLGIAIPAHGTFMAMDYHLDWIYASLFLCGETDQASGQIFNRDPALITASQEDVDLLIAAPVSEDPSRTNLIMIEAKGATAWTNKQAESKAERLNTIFVPGTFEHLIQPHYLIWSPRPSRNLRFETFPEWAKRDGQVPHLELGMDEGLQKVTRCRSCGTNDVNGEFWKVGN
jgi:hypothetical protein